MPLDTLQITRMTIEGYDDTFHPHGIDLYIPSDASQDVVLFVVNHCNTADSVLRFKVDSTSNTLYGIQQ
jgi:hypothetical protein